MPLTAFAMKEANTIDELISMYSSESCKTCHAQIYEQWSKSMHANPINSSLGGMRNYFEIGVKKEWNRKITKNEVMKCLDCHAPVTNYASEKLAVEIAGMIVKANDTKDEKEKAALKKELAKLTVDCIACHNLKATEPAIGLRGEPEKGAVYGIHGKQSPGHKTIKSAELNTSLFCMQCHGTYKAPDGEIIQCNTLSGSYQENYIARGGYETCQDCHMRAKGRGHAFPGGTNLDIVKEGIGFKAEITGYRHLPGKGEKKWKPSALVNVELQNNAGHRIPDG